MVDLKAIMRALLVVLVEGELVAATLTQIQHGSEAPEFLVKGIMVAQAQDLLHHLVAEEVLVVLEVVDLVIVPGVMV
jgi:hypothetical protein